MSFLRKSKVNTEKLLRCPLPKLDTSLTRPVNHWLESVKTSERTRRKTSPNQVSKVSRSVEQIVCICLGEFQLAFETLSSSSSVLVQSVTLRSFSLKGQVRRLKDKVSLSLPFWEDKKPPKTSVEERRRTHFGQAKWHSRFVLHELKNLSNLSSFSLKRFTKITIIYWPVDDDDSSINSLRSSLQVRFAFN